MWNTESKESLIKVMETPFRVAPAKEPSVMSKSISKRENDPKVFIKRITPQILETYQKGLPYLTPEEWDSSFYRLGGGQSRRKSSSILERMTWEQFLVSLNKVIENSLS